MKIYSLNKFNKIISENVVDRSKRLIAKISKYAPSLIPICFVRDRVLIHNVNEGKTYLCRYYEKNNGNQLVLDDVEEVIVKDNILSKPLNKIFEALENDENPIIYKDYLLEAIKEKVRFNLSLSPIINNITYSLCVKDKARNKVSKKLKESIQYLLENNKNIKKYIKSNSQFRKEYSLKEGDQTVIDFSYKYKRNKVLNESFVWNLKLARKSIAGSKIQQSIIKDLLNEYQKDNINTEFVNEACKQFVNNLVNPYLLTRADLILEMKRVADKNNIFLSEKTITKIADNIYTHIVENNKNEIKLFLENVYQDLETIKEAEIYNAICVARKAMLLFENDKNVDVEKAQKEATNEEDDLVDEEVEEIVNDKESNSYTIDDVEKYLNILKDLLKELDPEKYASLFSEEDTEDEDDETNSEDTVNKDEEKDNDEDLFDSEENKEDVEEIKQKINNIKESKRILKRIFENVDGGNIVDDKDDLYVIEDDIDQDIEDETDKIVDEITTKNDEEVQQIVDMINDLKSMLDEGVVDNDVVDEIAKFLYDYIGNEEEVEEDEDIETEKTEETDKEEIETEEKDINDKEEDDDKLVF